MYLATLARGPLTEHRVMAGGRGVFWRHGHRLFSSKTVNRLIDRALAEPDPARRAALWAEADRRIMRDAPIVPLIWESYAFLWAPRVQGWVYDPWTTMPDLTTPWLDPPTH